MAGVIIVTTQAQVSSAARMLAGRLGYSSVQVQTGSRAMGVSWHVTFYRGDPVATAPDRTVRLGFTASQSYDTLHDMCAGVDLYRDATRDDVMAFNRDDRVELGFIIRSRGGSHVRPILEAIRDALETGRSARVELS